MFQAACIARQKPLLDAADCLSADRSSPHPANLAGPNEPLSSESFRPCLACTNPATGDPVSDLALVYRLGRTLKPRFALEMLKTASAS